MYNLFFWQNWPKLEKIIFFIFILTLLLSLSLLGIYWYYGLENVIHWDILSELDEVPAIMEEFSDGLLKFNINGNAYIVKESFLASVMAVNFKANYIFLAFYIIGLNLLLAAVTSLHRYWFLGGMVLFAGILITFHLENIFNLTNQTAFLIAFASFVGLAFYFNTFAPGISFVKRLAAFAILTTIAGITISYFSKITQPYLALTSYGILSAIVLTVIFILLVSHEILASLVWVVSKSGIKGKSSLNPFLIISSIYLLNVLLIYLEKNQYIDWSLLALNPMVLYILSTGLGIWGFRNACEESDTFNYRVIGGWLYLGLAIISSATIGFAFATANDPLIEAFEDFIIIAHLILGIAFFLYVIINFIQALQKGLPIHRILYKPGFAELSLFRLGAIVGIISMLSLKNFYTYYQTVAGYYNTIGDFYIAENDPQYAEAFYKEAIHSDSRNHKSNFALASLAQQANDKDNTGFFLKNALEKNPSPFAYAGLSKVLQEKDMFFDALFVMREGINKFPQNQQLLTNIAFLYEKSKVKDSTLHYLKLAEQNCTNCDLAKANLIAYYSKYNNLTIEERKQFNLQRKTEEYISLRANLASLDKKEHRLTSTNIELGKDSALNVSQFALLYNLATYNNIQFPYSSKALQKIQQKAVNDSFFEDLTFAIACQNYYREDKIEGLKQLATLANDSTKKKALYNQVVGMWFLQQGVYDKSIAYLAKAGDNSSVEILQKQDYQTTIKDFQQAQAYELLKTAKAKQEYDRALASAPLNPFLLNRVIDFYNTNLKKPNEAYNLIFNAIQLSDKNIDLLKIYIIQSLKTGVVEYAEDGLLKLQTLTSSADYQAFLSTYQAQKALMEKSKVGFE